MPAKSEGMLCPACKVDLVMSERQNIEIDYCPKCRGVWLDRGELEKLLSAARALEAEYEREQEAWARTPPPQASHHYGYDRPYKNKETGIARTPDRRSRRTRVASGTPIHIRQTRRASNKRSRSALGAPISASQSRGVQ